MSGEIFYSATAIKQLKKIGATDKPKVKKKLELLKQNPLLGKPLKGELSNLYSLKAWPLRILYLFDKKKKIITLVTVEYRGQVYK